MDTEAEPLPELFSRAGWLVLAKVLGLPRRQQQIARLICRGLTNAQIAEELGTSLDTIRMHSRALYRRLDVRTRVGVAVRLVLCRRQLVVDGLE